MNQPHGGVLISRWVERNEVEIEKARGEGRILSLTRRFVIDCLAIADGIFSPLEGFMDQEAVESVLEVFRLPDGATVWAIPVILPVKEEVARFLEGNACYLLEYEGVPFGWMYTSTPPTYEISIEQFCKKVFQTTDAQHPGVQFWSSFAKGYKFVSGKIEVFADPLPSPVDTRWILSPAEVRKQIQKRGWKRIVAFQTRNPIHRAHEYLIKCALETMDGALIHPLVGETKKDDIPPDVRMRCYEVLLQNYFPENHVLLSALRANMYYAGPREAIHHMIMRKNFGCTHMIIGRDHAGVGKYYGTYDAQDMARKWAEPLGIEPVTFEHAFYCRKCGGMATGKTCPHPSQMHVHLSGTEVRRRLRAGEPIPPEFSRQEVVEILRAWAQQQVSAH